MYDPPCEGREKIIEKFAWLPVFCDYEMRWLEKVRIRKGCGVDTEYISGIGMCFCYVWRNLEFLEVK